MTRCLENTVLMHVLFTMCCNHHTTHSYSCSNVQHFTSTQAAIRNSRIKFPWDLPPDAEKKAGRARVGQFLGSKGLNTAVWFKKSWFLYDFSLWPCRDLRVCILVFWSVLVKHLVLSCGFSTRSQATQRKSALANVTTVCFCTKWSCTLQYIHMRRRQNIL